MLGAREWGHCLEKEPGLQFTVAGLEKQALKQEPMIHEHWRIYLINVEQHVPT